MKYSFKESDYTTGYDCICVRLRSSWILLDSFIHSFIPSYRGKEQPPKRVLHRVRFNAPSFNFQYPLFSSRSSSNCLRLLLRPTVISILPSNVSSITCLGRQFLRKMWPIPATFLLFIVYCDTKIIRKGADWSISPQIFMIDTLYAYNHLPRSHVIRSDLGQVEGVTCVVSGRS